MAAAASSSSSSSGGALSLLKKAKQPVRTNKSKNAAGAPPRPMFDKGELHANLPPQGQIWSGDWNSELSDDALELQLPNFKFDATPTAAAATAAVADGAGGSGGEAGGGHGDTLVVTCSIPKESDAFALNLCPREHDGGGQIWLHFNPRQRDRGGCVVVDAKIDDDWVRGQRMSLMPLPQLFSLEKCQLAFHVTRQCVKVACNGYFFLQYGFNADRQQPPQGDSGTSALTMVAPQFDDSGKPYRW